MKENNGKRHFQDSSIKNFTSFAYFNSKDTLLLLSPLLPTSPTRMTFSSASPTSTDGKTYKTCYLSLGRNNHKMPDYLPTFKFIYQPYDMDSNTKRLDLVICQYTYIPLPFYHVTPRQGPCLTESKWVGEPDSYTTNTLQMKYFRMNLL